MEEREVSDYNYISGRKNNKSKIIASFISIIVIGILIVTGPAHALTVGFLIADNDLNKGEKTSFIASVKIESDEFLEIDYLLLDITGPMNVTCKFTENGSIIEGCDGITINQIEKTTKNPGYGYCGGYGYGYNCQTDGILRYNITLDSSLYKSGRYSSNLAVSAGENSYTSEEKQKFTIRNINKTLEGCSIRANEGNLIINEKELGAGDLNFHIPLGNAENGKGFLTAQKDINRFSYDFKVIDVLENTESSAIILVSGEYKIKRGSRISEEAVIYFDKTNNKITLIDNNFRIENMEVTFRKKC